MYSMTPDTSEAIFGWNNPDRLATATPTPTPTPLASDFRPGWIDDLCAIQDLFRVEEEDGGITELMHEQVNYCKVVPYARRLANHVLATFPAGADQHNVATALLGWIDCKPVKDRAWNIKSAALQLADLVEKSENTEPMPPAGPDDLPF